MSEINKLRLFTALHEIDVYPVYTAYSLTIQWAGEQRNLFAFIFRSFPVSFFFFFCSFLLYTEIIFAANLLIIIDE